MSSRTAVLVCASFVAAGAVGWRLREPTVIEVERKGAETADHRVEEVTRVVPDRSCDHAVADEMAHGADGRGGARSLSRPADVSSNHETWFSETEMPRTAERRLSLAASALSSNHDAWSVRTAPDSCRFLDP